MKSFNNFITERTKRDPNRPGGQTGSGRPSGAGRADAYADVQDPANTPRKGTGPAPRINPNPIPKVDPSKFSGAVDPDAVDVERIFKRIQGTGAVGTASKAEIQAAIDAARVNKGSDPYITKLASEILGGEKGETPEVVRKAQPVGTGQRYRDTTVPQEVKPRPRPTSTPKPADNVRLGVINRRTQQLDFSKNAELQAKRAARIDPKTGKATAKGVENFLLSRGGYARPGRNMSASEFANRRAEAERILANPGGAEYKAIEDKINQSDYAGKRIKRAPSNAPSFADVKAEIDARNPVRQTSVGPVPAKKTKTPSEVIAQTQQTKRLETPKVEQPPAKPAVQPTAQTSRTRQVPTSTRTTAQVRATSATSRPAVLRPLAKPPAAPAASKPAPIAPAPAKPVAATPAPPPVKPVAAPAPSPG